MSSGYDERGRGLRWLGGGAYRVERREQDGGFSVVCRGTQRSTGRPVALKVIDVAKHASLADACRAQETEAELAWRVAHPAVVTVLDRGVDRGDDGEPVLWIAMEWVDGVTLLQWLKELGPAGLTRHRCLALMRPVLEALAHAHRIAPAGVVHGDISPKNLYVQRLEHGGFTLRVLDWGVSKHLQAAPPPGTTTGMIGYNPEWAAPEQFQQRHRLPATDVYSLAKVIVYALTGRNVSLAQTPAAACVDLGAWATPLARALDAAPARRQCDAGELLSELEAALSTEALGVPAADDAPTRRATPTPRGGVRRARVAAATLALALAAAALTARATRATEAPLRPRTPVVVAAAGVMPSTAQPDRVPLRREAADAGTLPNATPSETATLVAPPSPPRTAARATARSARAPRSAARSWVAAPPPVVETTGEPDATAPRTLPAAIAAGSDHAAPDVQTNLPPTPAPAPVGQRPLWEERLRQRRQGVAATTSSERKT